MDKESKSNVIVKLPTGAEIIKGEKLNSQQSLWHFQSLGVEPDGSSTT